jgi:diaminopimelate epimerase
MPQPMELKFEKWHGSGNDFIMIDDRVGALEISIDQIRDACQRHTGVGSDGLIIIRSAQKGRDFNMDFYNPDGSQSFCGNGSRCAFAYFSKLSNGVDAASFEAIDGIHRASWSGEEVRVSMNNVSGKEQLNDHVDLIDTGSPHLLVWCEDPDKIDIIQDARRWRYNGRFASEGVNVNFLAWHGDHIHMRTYERGVEAETLSCGTGVTAAAISAMWRGLSEERCAVRTKGGVLEVSVGDLEDGRAESVFLTGPVRFVYSGLLEL